MKTKTFLFSAGLLFIGCSTVKRYKKIETVSTDNNRVTMNLFGTKIDVAKAEDNTKSLWDLQGEGQAELIKAFNTRYGENKNFDSQLNIRYLKPAEKKSTDFTNKDLKLIFSIAKKRDYTKLASSSTSYNLADRIEYLKFKVTIDAGTNLKFVKWNKFTSEYATVDIADVSFTQSLELNGSLGTSSTGGTEASSTVEGVAQKATTGSSFSPSISAKGSMSKTETQKVRYRYLQLNGAISDKEISIEQEGMREIDLTGNVIADVNLKFDEGIETLSAIDKLMAQDGTFNPMASVNLTTYTVTVPTIAGIPDEVNATLTYDYVYRHVVRGEKTFYEWDDKIEYVNGTSSQQITLFKKKDLVPGFAQLAKIGEDRLAFNARTRLIIEENFGAQNTYELIFSSNTEAAAFLDWLTRFAVGTGHENDPIVLGSYKLRLRANQTDSDVTHNIVSTTLKNKMQVLPYYR